MTQDSKDRFLSAPHVVVIGAGFAGLRVAKSLANAPVRVTVIDRRNHNLFQPLLYQVATAGLADSDIAVPIRTILRRGSNIQVLMGEVIVVDPEKREVMLKDGDRNPVTYDYLVLATGSEQNYFGHNEWEKFAPGLKSIGNANFIRERILRAFEEAEAEADTEKRRALLRFVVVGGGPTGVEMAGAIAELTRHELLRDFRNIDSSLTEVVLVEAGPRILAPYSELLSRKAADALTRLRVRVITGEPIQDVKRDGVVISGKWLASQNIIWAAGVVASPVGRWLRVETDRSGRVHVLPNLTVPGYPEIFVVGDTAHFLQDGKPLPGVAPVAMQQGRYVGSIIRRVERGRIGQPRPFCYRDKGSLATVGRTFAVAQFGRFGMSGISAWLAWVAVHIFYLIGFRNRILVMIQWACAYFTYENGARLIIEEKLKNRIDQYESKT